jgi:hypothetical protein
MIDQSERYISLAQHIECVRSEPVAISDLDREGESGRQLGKKPLETSDELAVGNVILAIVGKLKQQRPELIPELVD